MFTFIKTIKELHATTLDIELIQRAEKRFNGIGSMVYGWVIQNNESNKILWAVADTTKSGDIKQFGLICMNPGKPLVYCNVKSLRRDVPELARGVLSFDLTSAIIGLSDCEVLGRAYTTISMITKANKLLAEGRGKEAMKIEPPVTLMTPDMAKGNYLGIINKVYRNNGLLVVGNDIDVATATKIAGDAESQLLVESVLMVM